jgi:hypothetical protein
MNLGSWNDSDFNPLDGFRRFMFESIDPARAARLIPLGSKIESRSIDSIAIRRRHGSMIAALPTRGAHPGLQGCNGLHLTRAEVEITGDKPPEVRSGRARSTSYMSGGIVQ